MFQTSNKEAGMICFDLGKTGSGFLPLAWHEQSDELRFCFGAMGSQVPLWLIKCKSDTVGLLWWTKSKSLSILSRGSFLWSKQLSS